MNTRSTRSIATTAILFVLYQAILFLFAGFTGHTATFWTSYAAVLVSFAAVFGALSLMGNETMRLRDWLFAWPLIKHSVLFLSLNVVLAAVFMIFEHSIRFGITFAIHLILLAVYAVFAISCMAAQDTVKEARSRIELSTTFMMSLRPKTEQLARIGSDIPELKTLAENVRFSDPVSNPLMVQLEQKLGLCIGDIESALNMGNKEQAKALCIQALELLQQRNDYCRSLKGRSYESVVPRQ